MHFLTFLLDCISLYEYSDRNGDGQNNYSKIIEIPLHKLNLLKLRFHAIMGCSQEIKKIVAI